MIGLIAVLAAIVLMGVLLSLLGWRRDRVSPLSREFWTAE